MKKVLNVGGNSKEIPLPSTYNGWQQVLLDIDPAVKPDVLCDARELATTAAAAFDSVYCSHNLEHYYRHEVAKVLAGFRHVLKADGYALIRVPDLAAVMAAVVARGLDVEDVLYDSPAGPITVCDVLYGFGKEIERSGNDFFAHKTGFTEKSLRDVLAASGFAYVYTGFVEYEVVAYAFLNPPDAEARERLKLPD